MAAAGPRGRIAWCHGAPRQPAMRCAVLKGARLAANGAAERARKAAAVARQRPRLHQPESASGRRWVGRGGAFDGPTLAGGAMVVSWWIAASRDGFWPRLGRPWHLGRSWHHAMGRGRMAVALIVGSGINPQAMASAEWALAVADGPWTNGRGDSRWAWTTGQGPLGRGRVWSVTAWRHRLFANPPCGRETSCVGVWHIGGWPPACFAGPRPD